MLRLVFNISNHSVETCLIFLDLDTSLTIYSIYTPHNYSQNYNSPRIQAYQKNFQSLANYLILYTEALVFPCCG